MKKRISELIRKAVTNIYPETYHDFIQQYAKSSELRQILFDKNPKCFLKLDRIGRPHLLFPICNRAGMHDPEIIAFSMKYAKAIASHPTIDSTQINMILVKLKRLHKKYSQEVPKTPRSAYKKGQVTQQLNRLKDNLKAINSPNQ